MGRAARSLQCRERHLMVSRWMAWSTGRSGRSPVAWHSPGPAVDGGSLELPLELPSSRLGSKVARSWAPRCLTPPPSATVWLESIDTWPWPCVTWACPSALLWLWVSSTLGLSDFLPPRCEVGWISPSSCAPPWNWTCSGWKTTWSSPDVRTKWSRSSCPRGPCRMTSAWSSIAPGSGGPQSLPRLLASETEHGSDVAASLPWCRDSQIGTFRWQLLDGRNSLTLWIVVCCNGIWFWCCFASFPFDCTCILWDMLLWFSWPSPEAFILISFSSPTDGCSRSSGILTVAWSSCAKVSAASIGSPAMGATLKSSLVSTRYNPLADNFKGTLVWCRGRRSWFWLVSIMAPNARRRVFDTRKGVAPSTTAIFSFMPARGTTIACAALRVPWLPKRNVISHDVLWTCCLTSGSKFLRKLETWWLPITVLVAPVSKIPHVSCDANHVSASAPAVSWIGLAAGAFGCWPVSFGQVLGFEKLRWESLRADGHKMCFSGKTCFDTWLGCLSWDCSFISILCTRDWTLDLGLDTLLPSIRHLILSLIALMFFAGWSFFCCGLLKQSTEKTSVQNMALSANCPSHLIHWPWEAQETRQALLSQIPRLMKQRTMSLLRHEIHWLSPGFGWGTLTSNGLSFHTDGSLTLGFSVGEFSYSMEVGPYHGLCSSWTFLSPTARIPLPSLFHWACAWLRHTCYRLSKDHHLFEELRSLQPQNRPQKWRHHPPRPAVLRSPHLHASPLRELHWQDLHDLHDVPNPPSWGCWSHRPWSSGSFELVQSFLERKRLLTFALLLWPCWSWACPQGCCPSPGWFVSCPRSEGWHLEAWYTLEGHQSATFETSASTTTHLHEPKRNHGSHQIVGYIGTRLSQHPQNDVQGLSGPSVHPDIQSACELTLPHLYTTPCDATVTLQMPIQLCSKSDVSPVLISSPLATLKGLSRPSVDTFADHPYWDQNWEPTMPADSIYSPVFHRLQKLLTWWIHLSRQCPQCPYDSCCTSFTRSRMLSAKDAESSATNVNW